MAYLIYLASPYSHPSEAIRNHRYFNARRFTIEALKAGTVIFSPIVYGKDMETAIGTAFEPWQKLNDSMIEICDAVWVLCDHEWKRSRGVRHELELAHKLNKPVRYFSAWGVALNDDTGHA